MKVSSLFASAVGFKPRTPSSAVAGDDDTIAYKAKVLSFVQEVLPLSKQTLSVPDDDVNESESIF
jgi:hypothetical protein